MKVHAGCSGEPEVGELVLDRYQAINLHWLLSCVITLPHEELPSLDTGDWSSEVLVALDKLMLQSAVEILPANEVYPEGVPEFSKVIDPSDAREFYLAIAYRDDIELKEFGSANERVQFIAGVEHFAKAADPLVSVPTMILLPDELNENEQLIQKKYPGLWEKLLKLLEDEDLEHLLD